MKLKLPVELIFWITALALLFLWGADQQNHFTVCPLARLGFTWCPGCGMGRSIAYLLHGELLTSFKLHWFGVPALLILFFRIVQLFKKFMLTLVTN